MWQELLRELTAGNRKALARSISLVENEREGYLQFLASLPLKTAPVIGLTGPPGAGKSTIVDGLIAQITKEGKTVAVLCVDPSSPFHLGAVLGDRIRMSQWYTHPQVFIRSLASRGALGGLHPKILELTGLLQAAAFDYILVETVGVGQSEVEIAGLADVTVVALVPEGGDEVQTMKAGLMEIGNIFVVNKSDRPGADAYVGNLRLMLAPAFQGHRADIPVIKTVASEGQGLPELFAAIRGQLQAGRQNDRHFWLLAERAYQLIQKARMQDVSKARLKEAIQQAALDGPFNLYQFIHTFSQ
ncbi:methylmalonyl Co-A mutase-associated GTPase MeaB [Paraflavisolibacter sp. H34]|uniref:methylmalonyl Co-A mutase-associated GTPase MeaB n=1 Tax=Huijunlia imazamoxiresistens TaxID=3127457 RepID=UPI0030177226